MKNEDLSLGILDIGVLISEAVDQQVTSCGLGSLAEGRVFALSSFVPGSRSDCLGVVHGEWSFGNSCIKSLWGLDYALGSARPFLLQTSLQWPDSMFMLPPNSTKEFEGDIIPKVMV